MKVKMNFKTLFPVLIIPILFLTTASELIAQKKFELKDFKIIIEKTDAGIKMKSTKGSAWTDLTFNLKDYSPQAVDEFGIARSNMAPQTNDEDLADFLFTIAKTKNGIELKGIEGTAWSELKFTLAKNKKQIIDQFGITSFN